MDRRLHLGLAIGLLLTIFGGFWPSYFGPLLHGTSVQRATVVHVHAAVFAVWAMLVVVQASLVASGRIVTHRRLGIFAALYGALVFAMGLIVSVAAPVLRVHAAQMNAGQASLVALYNLTDMLLFGGFFVAALLKRKVPDLHRRLMLSATIALAGAAVGRIIPGNSPWYLVVWLWPLLALISVEGWTRRRVHFVSMLSLVLFVLASFKVQLYGSSLAATRIGSAVIAPFL